MRNDLKDISHTPLLIGVIVFLLKSLILLTQVISSILSTKANNEKLLKKNLYSTKFLSKEGNLYVLHPALRVCLRTESVLIIDIITHKVFSIEGHQAKILSDSIRERVIFEQFMSVFIQSKILTKINLGKK